MSPEESKHRIPDIVLEQYLLGALSESEREQTEEILSEDEQSRSRLDALKESNREILEQYPPELMAQRIRTAFVHKYGSIAPKRTSSRVLKLSMAAVAAGVILILFLPVDFGPFKLERSDPIVRIKGQGPSLQLHRKTPTGSQVLEDGAKAFEGDVIRISYQAAGRNHGVIVSIDGRGLVTLHWPDHGNRSAPLKQNGQVLLNFAIELDDAPRWERFYFVTSDLPFQVNPILQAAERIDIETPADQVATLDLPEHQDQFSFSLRKGVRK